MHGFWHKKHHHSVSRSTEEDDVIVSCDSEHLFRKEFYVLWNSGLSDINNRQNETAAVCHVNLDRGSTILTRVFHGSASDIHHAEDKAMEWIKHENYVKDCRHLKITIFLNYSPLYCFSKTFTEFKLLLSEQDIPSDLEIKVVRMWRQHENDDDHVDNVEGLKMLIKAGVKLSALHDKDWSFLRENLLDYCGLAEQEVSSRQVNSELRKICSD